ncbi:EAL domain-containing protein [Massilia sp. CMS3.1]|uniref:EAL domain-containing protein n=1 Tax=Massilia sp. CMS3.1 TaxID=3373083 RepID=UPI003EE7FABB
MRAALDSAIAENSLSLLYQPLANLQSGAVCSLEAVLCWPHPVHGMLDAMQIFALADAVGRTGAVGHWVLERACQDTRRWSDQERAGLKVAINVAPSQFCDPGFGIAVAGQLQASRIAPSMLSLEITEAALTRAGPDCDALLAGFGARGLHLTLDDFGAGHASLSNLKRYPFDAIKIDAHVVRNVDTDSSDAAMCRSIIAVAHHLGMLVVAEGVSTEAQCDFLRRNMCDHIQGPFFSLPLTPEQVDGFLAERRALPPHLLRMRKPLRRLLLVDDEPNILAALKRLLRGEQYQIYTAGNGQEGLALLAEHPVDVIVSDQRMPGMVGADFLRKARQQYPETIRIMLSGYTELQSVTDAVNEGAIYKFLTKPWDDEQLRAHIAEAFRVKEIADENLRLNLEVRTANQELAEANRRMEQLLTEKQHQISRDEISLNIARELLQHLPLPVIGLDDAGVIVFINGAAERLFGHGAELLGNEAASVLPALFVSSSHARCGAMAMGGGHHASHTHLAEIDGRRYAVVEYPMGEHSTSRGSLITLGMAGPP